MILDHEDDYPSRWSAVVSVADKIGRAPQTLHEWVKKEEVDSGKCAGVPSATADKLKALGREVRELRQANEILRKASAYFCAGRARFNRDDQWPLPGEPIHRRRPWRSFEAVEFATFEWVDWFNHRRLLEPIGNIPPAEAKQRYYAMLDVVSMAA